MACATAFALPALADTPTIDTYGPWNKTDGARVGCPANFSNGQGIYIPARMHHLNQVTLFLQESPAGGGMTLRLHLYQWDPTNHLLVGNSLFDSPPHTPVYNDEAYHAETFNLNGIAVVPGTRYVLILSAAWEYIRCSLSVQGAMYVGFVANNVYKGGGMVQGPGADDTVWPTYPWKPIPSDDFAMQVYLSP